LSLELHSVVEQKATRAEQLAFASGFSLRHVKKSVAELLGLIGGSAIFDQYTKHDISHINRMLEICDWVAPSSSIERMTPADCLMLTLGVYFHDMGMLVTEQEYRSRAQSDFPIFKMNTLFDCRLLPLLG
jgi:molecular chaperone HtpG